MNLYGTVYSVCVFCSVVSDHLLFELGNEVGSDWKELAQGLGMAVKDMDNIEMEARTRKDQAWKMLQLWHSIKGRDFNVDEIFQKLQQIRKKQQTKQQRSKWLCSLYFDCSIDYLMYQMSFSLRMSMMTKDSVAVKKN